MHIRDPGLGEPFEVDSEKQDKTVFVRLAGAFGAECENQFRAELQELEEKGGAARLILDLRRLTFIDSTGLRLILEARDRFRSAGLDFAVTGGRGQVRRSFKLTGLDRELAILDDPSATLGGDS